MSDEKDKPLQHHEGDPEEVKVVQDIFDLPVDEDSGENIFDQDLFAAPPPPEHAAPPPEPEPEPAAAEPEPEPPPETPPADDAPPSEPDAGVKVVSFDDFDKLNSSEGLSVEAKAYAPGDAPEPDDEDEEDAMPDIVAAPAPSEPPAAEAEAETAEPPEEVIEEQPEAAEEVEEAELDADISMEAESDPKAFKAAKAKEGPEAVKQTQEFIEHLDGMDQGFLDAADIERTIKLVGELQEEIKNLTARIEALEERLK